MQNNITKELILSVNQGVKSREEDFGLLVISKTTPALALNDDAMMIWNLCDGINTVGDIIRVISEQNSEVDVEPLVIETLENFLTLGLMSKVN